MSNNRLILNKDGFGLYYDYVKAAVPHLNNLPQITLNGMKQILESLDVKPILVLSNAIANRAQVYYAIDQLCQRHALIPQGVQNHIDRILSNTCALYWNRSRTDVLINLFNNK